MPWLPRPDIKESNKKLKVHSKRFTWRVITFRDELKSIDFRLETNELFFDRFVFPPSFQTNVSLLYGSVPYHLFADTVLIKTGHLIPRHKLITWYRFPASFSTIGALVWTGEDARRSEGTTECTRIVEFQTFCFKQTF